jgi:sugar phosphate isomerase/epimerase
MRFGLSTHLFHGVRLERSHLERVAAAEFEIVELFATRTHLDYHDAGQVAIVGRWLSELGLTPWSMHLPICDGFTGGVWGRAYSNASAEASIRREAIAETTAALSAARDLGVQVGVLHLGLPHGQPIPPRDNDAGAAAQSLEAIADVCASTGIQLALEIIPNTLSTAGALLDWLSGERELGRTGVCMDVGHAHLTGGAPEAIELLSGYLVTTHLHDNDGRGDDHLVPFDGTLDWPGTLMAFFKVGYGGPLVLELPDHGDAEQVLRRTVAVRRRFRAILDDLETPFEFEDGALDR